MMNFLFKLLGVSILCLVVQTGNGQEIKSNEKGERIVVFPDGTWIKYPERQIIEDEPVKEMEATENDEKNEPSQDQRKVRIAYRVWQTAKEEIRKTEIELEKLTASEHYSEFEKQRLESILNHNKTNETAAKAAYEELKAATELNEQPPAEMSSITPAPSTQPEPIDRRTTNDQVNQIVIPQKNQTVTDNSKKSKSKPCHFAFEGKDAFTGQFRRESSPQMLFFYTPKELRDHYPGREFLTANISITNTGGFYFLNLDILILAKNAGSNYGSLEQGSFLELRLVDGTVLQVVSITTDSGTSFPANEGVAYRSVYPLDLKILNKLKNTELDMVRIYWSSGFEDYEIYEVDVLAKQLRCLENK